ncbi:hypothetical protein AB0D29_36710 [Streptomyces sp. NPDC048424]|uniref:hypothetical protein n=1 Tax=Streptomyces sp. NPDC048424 TaxID=3155265 RepID=UPI003449E022
MDSSTPSPLWAAAARAADLLLQQHDLHPGLRDERRQRLAGWGIAEATGSAAVYALLALSLHWTARQEGAEDEHHAKAAIDAASVSSVVARIDHGAKHELLAELPASALGRRDQQSVDVVKLLIRSGDDRSELALERISRSSQRVLLELARRQPSTQQTIRSLLSA